MLATLVLSAAACGDHLASADDDSDDVVIGEHESPTRVSLYAGVTRTCAVLDGRSMRCWGEGKGFPGEEDIGDDEVPASVDLSLFGDEVVDLAIGHERMCAVLATDQLRCWGRLFDETTSFPDSTQIPAHGVVQAVVEHSQECFLFANGGVKCRGYASPVLGYGHDENVGDDPDEALDAIPYVDVGDPVRQIAMFYKVVCAVTDQGQVRCWGTNGFGRLGIGPQDPQVSAIGDDDVPADYPPIQLAGGPVTQVVVGGYVGCALHEAGQVSCWGYAIAPLGYGPAMQSVGESYGDDEPPDSLGFVPLGGTAIDIAATQTVTCALLEGGDVKCWGTVAGGYLGYPGVWNIGEWNTPADQAPLELDGRAIDIVGGERHICALLDTQAIRCWGDAGHGVLGYGSHEDVGDNETPADAGDVPYLR